MSSLTLTERLRQMSRSSKLNKTKYVEMLNNLDKEQTSGVPFPMKLDNKQITKFKERLVQDRLGFLNNASKEELKGLEGIGEERAAYILELREKTPEPFKSIDDIRELGLSTEEINAMMAQALGDFDGSF